MRCSSPGRAARPADMRETVERRRPDLLELAARGGRFRPVRARRRRHPLGAARDLLRRPGRAGSSWQASTRRARLMAGHSLGEITALVAAGAVGAEDGLRLVAARGRLMQEAAEETGDGGMTAVRARDGNREADRRGRRPRTTSRSRTTTRPTSSCSPARSTRSTDAEAELSERGVRGKRLPVAGAFHSPLMEPAVEPFRTIVDGIEFAEPSVPVISCVTAEPVRRHPRQPRRGAHRAGALARRDARARRARRRPSSSRPAPAAC